MSWLFCFCISHHYYIQETDDDYESPTSDDGGGSDYESPTDEPEDPGHDDYEPPPSEKHEVHPICPAKPMPDGVYIGDCHVSLAYLFKSLCLN